MRESTSLHTHNKGNERQQYGDKYKLQSTAGDFRLTSRLSFCFLQSSCTQVHKIVNILYLTHPLLLLLLLLHKEKIHTPSPSPFYFLLFCLLHQGVGGKRCLCSQAARVARYPKELTSAPRPLPRTDFAGSLVLTPGHSAVISRDVGTLLKVDAVGKTQVWRCNAEASCREIGSVQGTEGAAFQELESPWLWWNAYPSAWIAAQMPVRFLFDAIFVVTFVFIHPGLVPCSCCKGPDKPRGHPLPHRLLYHPQPPHLAFLRGLVPRSGVALMLVAQQKQKEKQQDRKLGAGATGGAWEKAHCRRGSRGRRLIKFCCGFGVNERRVGAARTRNSRRIVRRRCRSNCSTSG